MNQITVYDESGAAHNWRIKFTRADDSTTVTSTEVNVQVFDEKDTDVTSTAGAQVIKFDLTGHVDSGTKTLSFTKSGITATIDFSDVDLWSGTTTIRAASIDGRASGTITKIAVNAKGEIELGYSNEEKSALGAVALADFRDPQALQQRSGGLFSYDGTDRQFLASEDPRVGKAMSGRLEASNVDLSQQFGELILIQRGFQASSQIVSVSNDMIQQLFGIRGQG
jgi:flagellar hook protein FlgE